MRHTLRSPTCESLVLLEPSVQYLRVSIYGARGLYDKYGRTDGIRSYMVVKCEGMEMRTCIAGGTTEPRWDEQFLFPIVHSSTLTTSSEQAVKISLWEYTKTKTTADRCIGKATIAFSTIPGYMAPTVDPAIAQDTKSTWLTLEGQQRISTAQSASAQSISPQRVLEKKTTRALHNLAQGVQNIAQAHANRPAAQLIGNFCNTIKEHLAKPAQAESEVNRSTDSSGSIGGGGEESESPSATAAGTTSASASASISSSSSTAALSPLAEIQLSCAFLNGVQDPRKKIGTLHLELLQASIEQKPKSSINPYVVVHYENTWVRTSTSETPQPNYNQSWTFDVYDPASFITIGCFGDSQVGHLLKVDDVFLGKIRIRPSTLDRNTRYQTTFPLYRPDNKKPLRSGQVTIAITLECSNPLTLVQSMLKPPLNPVFYLYSNLAEMYEAAQAQRLEVVCNHFAALRPGIRREVTSKVLDDAVPGFGLSRVKINFNRLKDIIAGISATIDRFDAVCKWDNPPLTLIVMLTYLYFVYHPHVVLPIILLAFVTYMGLASLARLKGRLQVPALPDPKLYGEVPSISAESSMSAATVTSAESSFSEAHGEGEANAGEEDNGANNQNIAETEGKEKGGSGGGLGASMQEQVSHAWEDVTGNPLILLQLQWNEIKDILSGVQNGFGTVADAFDRIRAIFSWEDPRVSGLFLMVGILALMLVSWVPLRHIAAVIGLIVMRPPQLRDPLPPPPLNLFGRLPCRTERMYDLVGISSAKKTAFKGHKVE